MPEDYARQARETVALGFTGLKFDPFAHVHYWYGDDLASNGALTEKQKRMEWRYVAPSLDYELEILSAQSFSQR
jgi:L-alanine-DL-glutamate epimerase-like enolase superfamily enzyme